MTEGQSHSYIFCKKVVPPPLNKLNLYHFDSAEHQTLISTSSLSTTYRTHQLSIVCSSWWDGILRTWCMCRTDWMECTSGLRLDNYCRFHWVYHVYEHNHKQQSCHLRGKCLHCLLTIKTRNGFTVGLLLHVRNLWVQLELGSQLQKINHWF